MDSCSSDRAVLREPEAALPGLSDAAPELFKQLERVYASLGGECFDWEPVRAVLAKAQGGS